MPRSRSEQYSSLGMGEEDHMQTILVKNCNALFRVGCERTQCAYYHKQEFKFKVNMRLALLGLLHNLIAHLL